MTERSSSGFGACSCGSSMLHPTERPPASRAPRLAASISPGPPPVMTVNPSAEIPCPTSRPSCVVRVRRVVSRRTEHRHARAHEMQRAEAGDEIAHGAEDESKLLPPRMWTLEQSTIRFVVAGARHLERVVHLPLVNIGNLPNSMNSAHRTAMQVGRPTSRTGGSGENDAKGRRIPGS